MGRRAVNLIGRRFGRLVVLSQAPTLRYSRWHCRCDCGAECIVSTQMLHMGNRGTRSCGCLKREASRRNCWAGGRATAARWAKSTPEHTGPHPLDGWAAPITGACHSGRDASGTNRGAPTPSRRNV